MSEQKNTGGFSHPLERLVSQSMIIPLPCRVLLRPAMKSKNGKDCVLFAGTIPLKAIKKGDNKDRLMKGKIIFIPDELSKDERYYGWRMEECILHGI